MDKRSTKYMARIKIESTMELHSFLEPKSLQKSGSIPDFNDANFDAKDKLLENGEHFGDRYKLRNQGQNFEWMGSDQRSFSTEASQKMSL